MGKEKTMVLKLTPNMHVINFLSYFVVYFAPTLVLGYRFFFAQKPLSLSFLILFYAACLLCGEYCFWNYWHSEITKQKKHKSWLWSINVKEPNFWIFAYVIIQDFLIEGFIIYTVFQWNVPFVKIFFILSSVKLLGGMIQYLGWNIVSRKMNLLLPLCVGLIIMLIAAQAEPSSYLGCWLIAIKALFANGYPLARTMLAQEIKISP